MKNCNIVQDLLPLYADELTSKESNDFICQHIEGCVECRKLMERVCTPLIETDEIENADYKGALKTQKNRTSKRIMIFVLVALIVGISASLFFLQAKGYFNVIERQTSPDGKVTSTVYEGASGTLFMRQGIFTVVDKGTSEGTTTYNNASFDGMWWSPNSRYLVISMEVDDSIWLSMTDYENSSVINLDTLLDIAINDNPTFSNIVKYEDGRAAVECRFLQWSEYGSSMLIHYIFVDTVGDEHSGYFWYDCDTGAISGLMSKLLRHHEES